MNTLALFPLLGSMAQRGGGKHDPWRGYMTILAVNHGMIKSISILTAVIHQIVKFDVDKPRDCFCQKVKLTLAIRLQFSKLSAFDLDHVHHLPHALPKEPATYCLAQRNQ
jgi:hypothetical protein